MRPRFGPEIDRLRATLRSSSGDHLPTIQAAISQFDAAVVVANDEGRYVAANQAALELTGYSRDELESLGVADLTFADDDASRAALWDEFTVRGAQRGTYVLRTRTGEPRPVRYWAFASVAPGAHVSVLVPVEISRKRQPR